MTAVTATDDVIHALIDMRNALITAIQHLAVSLDSRLSYDYALEDDDGLKRYVMDYINDAYQDFEFLGVRYAPETVWYRLLSDTDKRCILSDFGDRYYEYVYPAMLDDYLADIKHVSAKARDYIAAVNACQGEAQPSGMPIRLTVSTPTLPKTITGLEEILNEVRELTVLSGKTWKDLPTETQNALSREYAETLEALESLVADL